MLKIICVCGARPNFMKIVPLMDAFAKTGKIETLLVHTGQHYDERMSDLFFKDLGIPEPDVNLGVGSASHAVQTAQIMLGFEPIVLEHRPDWIVVVGDVNSTRQPDGAWLPRDRHRDSAGCRRERHRGDDRIGIRAVACARRRAGRSRGGGTGDG